MLHRGVYDRLKLVGMGLMKAFTGPCCITSLKKLRRFHFEMEVFHLLLFSLLLLTVSNSSLSSFFFFNGFLSSL